MNRLNLLKALCEAPGVSGFEEPVLSLIEQEIAPFCDGLFYDRAGNLIAFRKGKQESGGCVLYSCHADEVGFVITHIEEDGRLRFESIGMDPKVFTGRKVLIGKNRIPGLIAVKPAHLVKKEERDQIPSAEDMYIDIGAACRREAEELGVFAQSAVFDSPFRPMGGHTAVSKALDDRVGCFLLCQLLMSERPYDAWFAFCIGEELGLRGSPAVARRIKPALCINVECTTAGDLCGVEGRTRTCALGEGAVLPFMDGASLYTPSLYRAARKLAEEQNIPVQTKTLIAGGTDAGAYQRSAGCAVLGLAVPTRYIHSANSLMDLRDMEAAEKLLRKLDERLPSLIQLVKGGEQHE